MLITRTEECAQVLRRKLKRAETSGMMHLDIRASDLHQEVWGPDSYPGPSHRIPVVCSAMDMLRKDGDVYRNRPPKGKGASLEIRYLLPR